MDNFHNRVVVNRVFRQISLAYVRSTNREYSKHAAFHTNKMRSSYLIRKSKLNAKQLLRFTMQIMLFQNLMKLPCSLPKNSQSVPQIEPTVSKKRFFKVS